MDAELRKQLVLPRHVGIIMDGNGRWAKQRGLERKEGHKAGAETFRRICDYASELGIEAITFYAFSTENWKRPEYEVHAIMDLFRAFLKEAQERILENEEKGYQIRFIGDRRALDEDIIALFDQCEKDSAGKNKTIVNVAVNYGGRAEIAHSVRTIAEKVKSGELDPQAIEENTVADYLYTAGEPELDLLIRPGGESRISNFLIWQCAYAELIFTDILWPDFTAEDFDRAVIEFCKRNRRFGAV